MIPFPASRSLVPPQADVRPVRRTLHGVDHVDPYAWLRADNWQEVLKDPSTLPGAIRDHLTAENAYAAAALAPQAGLRAQLVKEMRGRIKEDDAQPPFPDGPFRYYQRYRTGGDHAIVCRQPRGGGAEHVLLDGDAEAKGQEFFQLTETEHSPDHRFLAWAADTAGAEIETITVRDLASGADGDRVEGTTGSVVWLSDSSGFLYIRLDDNHRGNRVYLHRLGSDAADDVLLHHETDTGLYVAIGQTQDGLYALIDIHDHDTSEVRVVDPANPTAPPRIIAARDAGHRYEVDHHDGRFIILTNSDGAEDFKIVTVPVATPGRAGWRDLVPHEPGRLILKLTCYARHLVWMERKDAVPSISLRDWATGTDHRIAFDEPTYALSFSSGLEYDTELLRITYSSLSTPPETYDYHMAARSRTLLKRREIPSGHDARRYSVSRIDAVAPDGARVPLSILRLATTPLDGTAPCLLYGYGSYGIVIPAGFRSNILSLVERGFIYVIAHVRGGMDKGYGWYRDGKLSHKPNTFSDFLAAADHLVAAGYTGAGRIVAHGGSAGGLLMGAIANMRPDLFAGIIADVPFVDVVNTMLDKDLPLTPPEWPEWGNPLDSAAALATIRSYSPYDNVRAQTYPPMLIEAGLTDPRVTYWEPAKWAARLRATMTGGGPILLNINMAAGHGGASGRLKQLDDDARAYAFALEAVGRAG